MIDPSIALGYRPPQINIDVPSPIHQMGQILTLRGLMEQGQQRQLEMQQTQQAIQQGQLHLQQTQAEMKERQALADFLTRAQGGAQTPAAATSQAPGPPSLGQMMDGTPSAPATPQPQAMHFGEILRIAPNLGPGFIKNVLETQKSEAEAQGKQYDATAKKAEGLGRIALSVRDAKDPAAQFVPALMEAADSGFLDPGIARQMAADGYDKHKGDVQAFIDRALGVKEHAEAAKADIETLGKARDNASVTIRGVNDQAGYDHWLGQQDKRIQAALGPTYSPQLKGIVQDWSVSQENLPKTAEARRANLIPAAMAAFKNGPEEWQGFLQGLSPEDRPAFANAKSADDIWKNQLTAEQRQQAQQAAATLEETKTQRAQQNAIAKARLGIESARNKREQDIYQQTYGEGANPALVAVEPKLRVPATKEAQKAGDEYLKTNETADQMQSMLDLARAGNKAAGSNLPLVGVETLNAINGIKRINRDEIAQYQGAGSLFDQIQGKIGKLTVGQPIPKDVMDDIEKMHIILRQNAETSYKAKLGGINQNYRSNFQPVSPPSRNAPQSAAPKFQVGQTVMYNGAPHKIKEIKNGKLILEQ